MLKGAAEYGAARGWCCVQVSAVIREGETCLSAYVMLFPRPWCEKFPLKDVHAKCFRNFLKAWICGMVSRARRTGCQWHLLQRLTAARGGLTLAQPVEAIPDDLMRHPRAVRRDLAALEASYFPLLTERINGEVRWRLLDGSRDVPSHLPQFRPVKKYTPLFRPARPNTYNAWTSGSRSALAHIRTIGVIAIRSPSCPRPSPTAIRCRCGTFPLAVTSRPGAKWTRIACGTSTGASI